MTEETLNRANAIKTTIDKVKQENSRISKYFSKKDDLNEEELKDLFEIAMKNTSYTLNRLKEALDQL